MKTITLLSIVAVLLCLECVGRCGALHAAFTVTRKTSFYSTAGSSKIDYTDVLLDGNTDAVPKYDSAKRAYVIPYDGAYSISFSAAPAWNRGQPAYIALRLRSKAQGWLASASSADAATQASNTINVILFVGDEISVHLAPGRRTRYYSPASTTFAGHLLYPVPV